MNSYATTIHAYIHWVIGTTYWDELFRRETIDPKRTSRGKLNIQDRYYYKAGTEAKNYWKRAILSNYDILQGAETPALQSFFCSVHTLGNFVPVPFCSNEEGEFNRPRGCGSSKDYWDLTLACLYNYYADKAGHPHITKNGEKIYTLEWMLKVRDKDLEKRDCKTSANVNLCKKWLNRFGSWNHFIERHFLQDLVNQEGGGYGQPKELWFGHFNGKRLPTEQEQFETFFRNASSQIIA